MCVASRGQATRSQCVLVSIKAAVEMFEIRKRGSTILMPKVVVDYNCSEYLQKHEYLENPEKAAECLPLDHGGDTN